MTVAFEVTFAFALERTTQRPRLLLCTLLRYSQPKLGVQEGELFHAEVLRKVESEHNGALGNPHSIPTGRWRDGLYDCCIHGCCHALCCLTYWCTPVALGQVLYRMNLSIFGNPTPRGQGVSPFKFMLALTIILNIVTHSISQAYPATFNPDGTLQDDSFWIGFNIIYAISFVLNVYIVFVIVKARYHMRRVYNIPESSGCIGCEDCCCAFWCTCCVVGQMARHTVDYTKYHPACCTDEGVDERVPPTLPVNKSGGTVQVDPQIV
jgi:Cys-rich protein (TIGR01571 family)